MVDQLGMFEEDYETIQIGEPLPGWNKSLSVVELYGGIGSQLKSLKNIGVDISSHTLVEVDIDATISYAAIHCDLNEQVQLYLFPKKERMIEELLPYGWWRNEKPYNINKLKLEKLEKLYLAQKLTNNLGDVFKLTGEDIPHVDLITWSTPCQDFSLAGKQAGFDGKKGGLTYVTLELFEQLRELNKLPKFMLFENVPAIISEKFINGFMVMLDKLENLGYENIAFNSDKPYMKLNAKHYGIPQNRDRVFILSIHKDYLKDYYYQIPNPVKLKLKLKDMLQDNVDNKRFISDELLQEILSTKKETPNFTQFYKKGWFEQICRVWKNESPTIHTKAQDIMIYAPVDEKFYLSDKAIAKVERSESGKFIDQNQEVVGTIIAGYYKIPRDAPYIKVPEATKKGYAEAKIGDGVDLGYIDSETRRGRVEDEISHILTTQSELGVVTNNLRIRRLTPLECWRLMGFDDIDFFNAKAAGLADSQLYKQAGNSIVVDVLEAIFKSLLLG